MLQVAQAKSWYSVAILSPAAAARPAPARTSLCQPSSQHACLWPRTQWPSTARQPGSSRRPVARVASTAASGARGPTVVSRLLSGALFALPLVEGGYRLLVVAVGCCWQWVLDLWAWCLMQQDALQGSLRDGTWAAAASAAEELQACDSVTVTCHHLYLALQAAHHHLALLSHQPLLSLPWQAPWLPAATAPLTITPAVLWDAACASSMLLILQLVRAPGALPAVAEAGSSEPTSAQPLPGAQLVAVSFWCTVLLRVAWAPLGSLSGTLPQLYGTCAVLLTASTAFLCLAAIGKVLFNGLEDVKVHLREVAEGTQGVVLWHRALVYLDWLLSVVGHSSGSHKLLLTARFLCYALAVDMCTGELHMQLAACH